MNEWGWPIGAMVLILVGLAYAHWVARPALKRIKPPPPEQEPDLVELEGEEEPDDSGPPEGYARIHYLDGTHHDYQLPPAQRPPEQIKGTVETVQPVRCQVCHRILRGKVAIEHAMGRTCRRKVLAAAKQEQQADADQAREPAAVPAPLEADQGPDPRAGEPPL